MSTINLELSHLEVCGAVAASISEILENDSLLNDIPSDVTVAEVKSQIAVEVGQSIQLYLKRDLLETIKITVVKNCSIHHLKKAIEQQVARYIQRQGKHTTHISWKYFWRKHWLTHNGIKLSDDNLSIQDYNIKNKDYLSFCKKLKKCHETKTSIKDNSKKLFIAYSTEFTFN